MKERSFQTSASVGKSFVPIRLRELGRGRPTYEKPRVEGIENTVGLHY